MLSLLRADFYKLRRSKAFWVCMLVGIVISVLMIIAMNAAMNRVLTAAKNPAGPAYMEMQQMHQLASGVWAVMNSLTNNFQLILVGIFSAIFVTAEFGYGTMKNTLSRGAKRINVFASKFIVSSVASLAILLTFMAASLVTGTVAWGFDPQGTVKAGGFIGMLLLQMLVIVAFTALFTFFSMTIRSGGGAIATNIVVVLMVPTLLKAINALVSSSVDLSSYWLGWAVTALATTAPATVNVWQGVVIALAWGAVSLVLGTLIFQKRDVK